MTTQAMITVEHRARAILGTYLRPQSLAAIIAIAPELNPAIPSPIASHTFTRAQIVTLASQLTNTEYHLMAALFPQFAAVFDSP